jgi:putative SOS response-associated peptidase YedK
LIPPAIFPGWNGSVIRKAADGEREMVTMSWGFGLLQLGKVSRRVINVRDDKGLAEVIVQSIRRWRD